MMLRKIAASLAVASAVGLAGAWTDITQAIAAREAGWVPTGAAVDDEAWAGDILSEAASEKGVEYVTETRPFDSWSFTLGYSDIDRFYSVPRPGMLLFLR